MVHKVIHVQIFQISTCYPLPTPTCLCNQSKHLSSATFKTCTTTKKKNEYILNKSKHGGVLLVFFMKYLNVSLFTFYMFSLFYCE